MKLSSKYKKKAQVYRQFAKDWPFLSFGEDELLECYFWETNGTEIKSSQNGFVFGKKWMDVNLAMWKQDLASGILFVEELTQEQKEMLKIS